MTRLAAVAAALVLLGVPGALAGQEPRLEPSLDSLVLPARASEDSAVRALPADSLRERLRYLPGVTEADGGLSLRGRPPGEYLTRIDGHDVTPAARMVTSTLPLAALRALRFGSGPGGAATRRLGASLELDAAADTTPAGWLRYGTDRVLGAGSLGINRLEGALARRTRAGSAFVAATLGGRKSEDFGMNARAIPMFRAAGIDTLVDTPFGEYALPTYAVTRGECDILDGVTDAGIADNYGVDCTGDRVPGSAATDWSVVAGLDTRLGRATEVSLLHLRSRLSRRLFDPAWLDLPAQRFATQDRSELTGLTLTSPFGRGRGAGVLTVRLSRQRDERLTGPLTVEGELDSHDPAGGLLLTPLDFRWDLESFPVDDSLVAALRRIERSRLSPHDLSNPDQYSIRDVYRQGPWGFRGVAEAGGPTGRIGLFEERRTVAGLEATWQTSRNARLTLGAEHAWYGVDSYSGSLTGTLGLDAWSNAPRRLALFASQSFAYEAMRLDLGVRYDRFAANADRPHVLDTLATLPGGGANPRYGDYYYFPRHATYTDLDGRGEVNGQLLPLVTTRRDEAHGAWSPEARLNVAAGRSTRLFAAGSREAVMPDLALVYKSHNTDIGITSPDETFGSDLDFARAWSWEGGVEHQAGAHARLRLTGFSRTASGIPAVGPEALDDPTRGFQPVDIRLLRNAASLSARGIEATARWRRGNIDAGVTATAQRVTRTTASAISSTTPAPWERPRSLAAWLRYDSRGDTPGPRENGTTAGIGLRWTSGLPYTPCAGNSFDAGVLSGQACTHLTDAGVLSARLPSLREVDLRVTTALGAGPGAIVGFVEARNLLNTRNTVTVFAQTGTPANAAHRAGDVAALLDGLRDEFSSNGVLQGDAGDLRFGAGGCGSWMQAGGSDPAAPSCLALLRAESRWGNGDALYTLEEQTRAAEAWYDARHGTRYFGSPRRVRVGLELRF